MKKKIAYVAFLLVCVSGTYLFARQGRMHEDHQELQDHYNTCSRVINEIRDARIMFGRGNSGPWTRYKKQVMDDLDRTETTLYNYRNELERMDDHLMRQELHARDRR